MVMDDSIKQKLDGLKQAKIINTREYQVYGVYIANRSPAEFKDLVLNKAREDVGHMIGGEMIKRTDKFLLTAAKFHWEQILAVFEKSVFISHERVLEGAKELFETLEKPVSLEISMIGEPETIKMITAFYTHGCPKTDKISINLKNIFFDSRFDYVTNWLQENGVKITSDWNQFSVNAQGTVVVAGGWHDLLKTKEFSERICHLISRKIPVVLLEKIECLDNEEGIRNLADVIQVSLFEDKQLVLINGDMLTVKPFAQRKSISAFPYTTIKQETLFFLRV